MSSIFDSILYTRVLYNIRKRRVLTYLLNCVKNFLKKQCIILIIEDYIIKKQEAKVNILQDFFLFLILYLFYNIDP